MFSGEAILSLLYLHLLEQQFFTLFTKGFTLCMSLSPFVKGLKNCLKTHFPCFWCLSVTQFVFFIAQKCMAGKYKTINLCKCCIYMYVMGIVEMADCLYINRHLNMLISTLKLG